MSDTVIPDSFFDRNNDYRVQEYTTWDGYKSVKVMYIVASDGYSVTVEQLIEEVRRLRGLR